MHLHKFFVLYEGTTKVSGFTERLRKDLTKLVPTTQTVIIDAPPERQYAAWIGGSILASIVTIRRMGISREQYDEFGPLYVHKAAFCN